MVMQTSWNENRAILRGTVAASPAASHENHGITYDTFPLSVCRLSGCPDVINVVAAQSLLEEFPLEAGMEVEIQGEVRSFNNKSGQGSRLVITLFARQITPASGPHCNELTLRGVLCKPPILRRTPLGREICDLMLAVNRRYGRADYLPCIAWGAVAQYCGSLQVGDSITLEGRLQSRTYTKLIDGQSQERVAYEISIMRLKDQEALEQLDP
ncbi:MAG: single-stranded DNA-binding protein [Oscillospiraceae bacterium]|nr:single-stranded DNA-binding protein [Oscillospiraceae bacterium]